MNIETVIQLNKFQPRPYQLPLLDALENKGYRKLLIIWPRRAGKDIACFNLIIRQALKRIAVYWYIYPTYSQAKKCLWDAINNDGFKFLDYIPKQLISGMNSQEMKITLVNGSIIQLIGSDNVDALVGTNPAGVVFSEYALQDERVYSFLRPILLVNQGFAIFNSTPRGKNHLYSLFELASNLPDWFCQKLTVEDTGHIPLHEIEKERAEGLISEDLIQQEYYTSFNMGVEGGYYTKIIDKLKQNNQIGDVPFEPGFRVNTAWDIGVRDSTSIIFFQCVGMTVRIIDYYENAKVGLDYYAKIVQQKEYQYNRHFGPHDIAVTEWGSGLSRIEKAKQLGIKFTIAPNMALQDGIESVRSMLPKCWIDEIKCLQLIKCLENYRQEFDIKKKIYKPYPLHNWASHGCFVGETEVLTRNGMRPIMEICDDDYVLTLEGWKKCQKSWITRKNAQLVEVKFEDGTIVKCTPDHFFLTENGWRYAKDLQKDMRIQSSLTNSRNTLMEGYIDYGLQKDTTQKAESICIVRFGRMLLEKFLRMVTYTIRTMISRIITFGIWSVCLLKYILGSLNLIAKECLPIVERPLLDGTVRKREDYGTKDMLKELRVGLSGAKKRKPVRYVELHSMQLSEKTDMNKNFVTPIAKQLIIEDVKRLYQNEDVYCIHVPEVGHFSLPNGAIVKNSDAMRYLALSLPKTRDGLSAQELDNRFKQAVLGPQASLPAVFRDDLPKY